MARTKWDTRFLALAHEVAEWSKDPEEGVGAVLVSGDKRMLSIGYNGLPTNIEDSRRRLEDKALKRALTLHAEENAILNCPVRPVEWTMYVTKHPCHRCALKIIQSGVVRVVTYRWSQDSSYAESCRTGRELLNEAGIAVEYM